MCTTMDIANEFGISRGSVNAILAPSSKHTGKRAIAIREYAKKNGYDPKIRCYRKKEKPEHFWCNGCFHTKAEEVARMKSLREEGYSNAQIAKKIGRTIATVRRSIGAQSEELTKMNRIMGRKIYAQKNAARKQYVINKPIIEYNKALEEKKTIEEKLEAILKDMPIKEAQARKNARAKVKCPSFSLETTTIAG